MSRRDTFALSSTAPAKPKKTKLRKGKVIAAGESEQEYETPWHIVRAVELDSFGGRPFDLDVAADVNNAKAKAYLDRKANGMKSMWAEQNWSNPTYENQGDWLKRAVYFAREHGFATASLVLASTSATYWPQVAWNAGTTDLYVGRIAFLDPETKKAVKGFDRASALVLVGPQFLPGVVRIRDALTGKLISQLAHGVQPCLI